MGEGRGDGSAGIMKHLEQAKGSDYLYDIVIIIIIIMATKINIWAQLFKASLA